MHVGKQHARHERCISFKFIQLAEEVTAGMASWSMTNYEEMCTMFSRAYMETRGRATMTPPTRKPQVVYLAQEYERPQGHPSAAPLPSPRRQRKWSALGGEQTEEGRLGECTTVAGAAVEEITDTSSRTCGFSHTGQKGEKTARRTPQAKTGTVKNPFRRIFSADDINDMPFTTLQSAQIAEW